MPRPEAAVTAGELSQADQDKKAFELFQSVLDISGGENRKESVPRMEAVYTEIIDKYPKAALSQESGWRLILLYMHDYQPPAYDKINARYTMFIAQYPSSPFRKEIERALSEFYYKNGRWQDLALLHTPAAKKYIEDGTLAAPGEMFMLAEAKMNLGDIVEAAKGYKIVIAKFPNSRESTLARQRLDNIRKMQEKK